MTEKKIWKLKLYVADETPISKNASNNLQRLCDEHLKDCCDLEIIDIVKNPEVAYDEQIVAIPTLVKQLPLPVRRFIGDLSNKERLLASLDIRR